MTESRVYSALLMVVLIATGMIWFDSVMASDELPRSYLKIPLVSRERIPISRILAYPDQYQMREIRLTGTVTAIQVETVTNRFVCGRAHERTMLTVEDDTGKIEVIDQGACGKNVGALKALMVKAGQQIDLLVQIMIPTGLGTPSSSIEATIRYIDLARE
ncbi:MAG: hypothetical protein OEU68_13355 [Nitrospira sp.]|nr:hypothetical protein [Nitrospira sp.]MDH4245867.1 hypothetical protein [Nitrospira sp.]MDH4356876.1 hypothetical protein [Nitrospira sp.]MDH5320073.1 hypothetical protein [Nitrospira sp.]